VISFVWLQSELFLWLELFGFEFVDFGCEDGLGRRRRVNATGLDRNHKVSVVLEEVVGVECDNAGLVGLCHVGEHGVDHADQHAILVRVTSVFDDRYDVCAFFGHVEEITTRTMGKFDGVNESLLRNEGV
jgi:hypothetical protein